ncbi:hypothetical protein L6259_03820 [Candidatus Parcubacteria bacterium]|nr:hypothetical protein [Candidatus Parcubacteria bacterium]
MRKMKKLGMLLFGILFFGFSALCPADASAANNKGFSHPWVVLSDLNSDIDKVYDMGGDLIMIKMTSAYINNVKNGAVDYIGNGIIYGNSKGVKVQLSFSVSYYGEGSSANAKRENFRINIGAQNDFISDLEWLMAQYQTLSGIDLEEFHSYLLTNGEAWRIFTNTFGLRAKETVERFKPTNNPDVFMWSFSLASTSVALKVQWK